MADQLKLTSSVGRGGVNSKLDVMIVQAALSLIKSQTGKPLYSGRVDGTFGLKSQSAVRSFMSTSGGGEVIRNGTPALKRLSDDARREVNKRDMGQKPYLVFDGQKLCWHGKPHNGTCWKAVSGSEGYQDAKYQSLKNKGPLPEGVWRVRQSEHQSMTNEPLWEQLFYKLPVPREWLIRIGKANWPGGVYSWGTDRIWLKPKLVNELYGRDPATFSIHGGYSYGSAGCVDLAGNVGDFVEKFRLYGADMDIVVQFSVGDGGND